jgi:hypothetical protein
VILPITDSWFVSSAFIGDLLVFQSRAMTAISAIIKGFAFPITDSWSVSAAFISGDLLVFRSRAMTAISAIE